MVCKKALVVFCLLVSILVQAQTITSSAHKQKGKITFGSYNHFGVLAGESGTNALVQTVNGISYKQWFAGIGVGLDDYSFLGIPIFLDIKRTILPSKPLFVYGDVGIHFPWSKKDKELQERYKRSFENGLYYDVGLGYRFPVSIRNALVFSAGLTEKRITEKIKEAALCLNPPCPANEQQSEFTLRRISLKLGFVF